MKISLRNSRKKHHNWDVMLKAKYSMCVKMLFFTYCTIYLYDMIIIINNEIINQEKGKNHCL